MEQEHHYLKKADWTGLGPWLSRTIFLWCFALIAAQAQNTNRVSMPSDIPVVRVVSMDHFGLGDSLEVEVDGTTPQLQTFTSDEKKLVLLLDEIPFRGMATNFIFATNATFVTNFYLKTNFVWTTNVTSAGTSITHAPPVVVTNNSSTGHLGTVRIEFQLQRTDANKSEWNRLLGSPTQMSRPVDVEVGMESNNAVAILTKGSGHPSQLVMIRNEPFFGHGTCAWKWSAGIGAACLAGLLLQLCRRLDFGDLFDGWPAWLWVGVLWAIFACYGGASCFLAFFLIFFGGFLYLAKCTELLRDSGPKPPETKLRTYSLARFQMAFWFFLSVSAFVFLWMITDTINTITGTVLVLMGIGAGTALGAEAQGKPKIAARIAELTAKNPRTPDEECELRTLTIQTLDVPCVESKQKNLKDFVDSMTVVPTEVELTQRKAELAAKVQRTPEEEKELANIPKLLEQAAKVAEAKARIEEIQSLLDDRPTSKGFFEDILTDDVGISFHRFQMFVWTIVLGIIFIFSVYRQLAMPEFNDTLLALMGISSGTYLGFMFAEAPTGTSMGYFIGLSRSCPDNRKETSDCRRRTGRPADSESHRVRNSENPWPVRLPWTYRLPPEPAPLPRRVWE